MPSKPLSPREHEEWATTEFNHTFDLIIGNPENWRGFVEFFNTTLHYSLFEPEEYMKMSDSTCLALLNAFLRAWFDEDVPRKGWEYFGRMLFFSALMDQYDGDPEEPPVKKGETPPW